MYVNRCIYEMFVFMLSMLFSETAANAFADLKAMNSSVMAEYTKVGYCMYIYICMYVCMSVCMYVFICMVNMHFCNSINIFLFIRRSQWMMYVVYMCKECKWMAVTGNVCFSPDDAVVVEKISERVQRLLHIWNVGLHRRIGLRHPLPPTGRPYFIY